VIHATPCYAQGLGYDSYLTCWSSPPPDLYWRGPGSWTSAVEARQAACLTPNRNPSGLITPLRAFFLVGDSHAGHLVGGLGKALQGSMAFSYTARGCCGYYPDSLLATECKQDDYSVALAFRDHVTQMLDANVQAGDVVAFNTIYNTHLRPEAITFYRSWLLPMLQARGAKLLLFGDTFSLEEGPSRCYGSSAWRCQRSYGVSYEYDGLGYGLSARRANAAALAAELPSTVYFLSLGYLFCTSATASGVCGAQVPGTTVVGYHDTEHLKLVGSVYMWPHLCAAFRQLSFF
jgi:hypothetical protein